MDAIVIHVGWDGPFQRADIENKMDSNLDIGVYQAYGHNPVYGRNALLYIGKTEMQTFGERLTQGNWGNWEYTEGEVDFFLGRLQGSETPSKERWKREIALVEALLIYAHKPSHNAQTISSFGKKIGEELKTVCVVNWGEFGSLLPEVTGFRWGKHDIPNYGTYGTHGC